MARLAGCVILLVIVNIASTLVNNTEIEDRNLQETRRRKKSRETSSSENAPTDDSSKDSEDESLGLTETDSSSSSRIKKRPKPKSSEERRGWRKWHRKCSPCPEDMKKKWRDPTINWICGAYQRARRTFKSICMMHYRNCQDGTMFVKIHDHRCENSSVLKPHGDHFFYDYKVVLSDDDSDSKSRSGTFSDDTSGI